MHEKSIDGIPARLNVVKLHLQLPILFEFLSQWITIGSRILVIPKYSLAALCFWRAKIEGIFKSEKNYTTKMIKHLNCTPTYFNGGRVVILISTKKIILTDDLARVKWIKNETLCFRKMCMLRMQQWEIAKLFYIFTSV